VGSDSMTASFAGQQYRLRVDEVGHILGGSMALAGLTFARVDAATAAKIVLGKPDYSAPPDAPYSSEEVAVRGPKGIRLGGTLTKPKNVIGPLPAVVTITGSGQQDRDEYIPVAGGYRPFWQIADTLGRRGIAVLRLDDRGVGSSGGKPATSTSAEFADDIRAGIAYLRTRGDIDGSRIGLIGHSEGGIVAPMVAATDPKLKAIVLLAGPADNGLDIIRYQQRFALDHDTLLTPTKRDSAYKAELIQLDSIAGKNAWIKFFLSYDPISTARKVKAPVLVLQGETDRQVSFEQAEKLGAAFRAGGNRDVTVHVFPGKNHLFIADVDGNPAAYGKLATNKIGGDVLGMIADWLVVRLKASSKLSPDHPM
jgi:Dipeptidyl aminopeptidases/acylaminoacyl-peptidases